MKVNFYEINKGFEGKSDIFFLKNQNIWLFLSNQRESRYFGGFLFLNNQVFRFLDDLNLNDEILEVHLLGPHDIILYFKNNQAYLRLNHDSLEVIFSFWQDINLTFDFKEIFKNEPEKRKIEIKKISSCCLVIEEFLEGDGLIKILIEADSPLNFRETWVKKKMDFDIKRNSPPYFWWVFDGVFGKVRELKLKIIQPEIKTKIEKPQFKIQKDIFLNFLLSRVQNLIIDNYLPAGLPWFYENWFRDELLCLYLLKETLYEDFLEKRLRFYLTNLEDIWDLNKLKINGQGQWIGADTFLLLLLNLNRLLFHSHFNLLEKYFSFWKNKFLKDGEFNLSSYSTWMDTLERKSALEIESLYLKALRKFAKVNRFYVEEADRCKEKLRWKIKNSRGDVNLIFSFLLLEDIFDLKEWEVFFDNLIKENFLDWGGFSTISRFSPNFKNEDDGENSQAYHSGDSWYFLNNLIAFALAKINSQKYEEIIKKIIKASLEDLFVDGVLGYSSEISSAKERRSEGSLVQLWSIASLIYFFLKSGYQLQTFERLL